VTASSTSVESPPGEPGPRSRLGEHRALAALGLLAAFLVVAIGVYRPALRGPFLSDDSHWLAHNPYVQVLSAENLWLIAQPLAEPSFAIGNYSPVALLILGAEYQVFGQEVTGYHVVNVCLHALASALLVGLLLRSRVPPVAALLGGAFFLLHPANVESVAWISQLKTLSSMVLGLGAVLVFSRHPLLATGLFALAILAKPTAFVALPFLAVSGWSGAERPRWIWLGVWLALLAIHSVPELLLQRQVGIVNPPETDLAVRARSILAFAARYLLMAASSWGVSTYHQPDLSRSWLDPWFLAGLALLGLLGWRTLWALRRRRIEGAWWLWAALSFAPISQVFPFIYPMADRYLYFVLPGLIGGVILAGRDLARRLIPAESALGAPLARGAVALALGILAIFAVHGHGRARIWASSTALFLDGATHYPNGIEGNILRALRAVREGDRDGAIHALQAAHARGFYVLESLLTDPALAPLRGDSRMEALIREVATELVESRRARPNANLFDLPRLAEAHLVLGQMDEAIAVLDRAAALRGSEHSPLRSRIVAMREYAEREQGKRSRAADGSSSPAEP
jgi:hypothetical protein